MLILAGNFNSLLSRASTVASMYSTACAISNGEKIKSRCHQDKGFGIRREKCKPVQSCAPNTAAEPGAPLLAGKESFQRKEPPELGGAGAFTPAGGGGQGPSMKSLPRELGDVCHLKALSAAGRDRPAAPRSRWPGPV